MSSPPCSITTQSLNRAGRSYYAPASLEAKTENHPETQRRANEHRQHADRVSALQAASVRCDYLYKVWPVAANEIVTPWLTVAEAAPEGE